MIELEVFDGGQAMRIIEYLEDHSAKREAYTDEIEAKVFHEQLATAKFLGYELGSLID